jgi:quercetin dioxygenase-like cupin family protein
VLKTRSTWNGAQIEYFETKCPEVEAVIVDIPANASTPIHLHPVNNYAYILEGQVTVQEGDLVNGKLVVRKSSTFTKGQAFAEVVNTWHVGTAGAAGVKILVWYTTAMGYPYTVTDLSYQVTPNFKDSSHCSPPKN